MQMEDYKKMYFELFNKITDTLETLKMIQQEAEEIYISQSKIDTHTNWTYFHRTPSCAILKAYMG